MTFRIDFQFCKNLLTNDKPVKVALATVNRNDSHIIPEVSRWLYFLIAIGSFSVWELANQIYRNINQIKMVKNQIKVRYSDTLIIIHVSERHNLSGILIK